MTAKKYPTPEEIQDAGLPIEHYSSKAEFQKAGGSIRPGARSSAITDDRYIVSALPGMYSEEYVENAIEAIDGFWDLFNEGGWVVFVWDNVNNEGWAWPNVGPDWIPENFAGMAGVTKKTPKPPSTPAAPADPNRSLSIINRHRAKIGMGRLDPVAAGYSPDELDRMARSIEDTGTMANPKKAKAKARLMR